MSLLKTLLIFIAFYYLYKFIFNVVVPVSKATSNVKSKIKQMQEQQEQYFNNQQQQAQQQEQAQKNNTVDKGDYIDFEEVK